MIIDSRAVNLKGKRVLFDANIWILLNGFGGPSGQRMNLYSSAHKRLLELDNRIVVNDYLIGEIFNKCVKIEYDAEMRSFEEAGQAVPHFKKFRASAAFKPALESVRDTCLNILDECEFIPVEGGHYDINKLVCDCCDRCIDFSDLVLIEFCKKESLYIMTDDEDFSNSGLGVITGNRRSLRR